MLLPWVEMNPSLPEIRNCLLRREADFISCSLAVPERARHAAELPGLPSWGRAARGDLFLQFERKTTSLPTSIQFALGDCFLSSHSGVAITAGLVMGGTMLRHFRNDRAITRNVSSRRTASCGLPGSALLGVHSRGRNLFIAAVFPHQSLSIFSFPSCGVWDRLLITRLL